MAVHTVERIENLPEQAPDAGVVVVDVPTASTSIVALLDQGTRHVRPFADTDADAGVRPRARGRGARVRQHQNSAAVARRRVYTRQERLRPE
jgi:phosphosulfolactate phosphohydrolase-like enzyme